MNQQTMSLKPDKIPHSLEMLNVSEENVFDDSEEDVSDDSEEDLSGFSTPLKHLLLEVRFLDKLENDLFKSTSSKIKADYPADKPGQCNNLKDDCLLESTSSAITGGSEVNTAFCNDEQNILVSAEKDLDTDCVNVILTLQKFLADIKNGLLIKELEVYRQKLYFETNAKKLTSDCNFDKTKGYVSDQFCKDLVDRYDKLIVDIKKDRVECDEHFEDLQNLLNFGKA